MILEVADPQNATEEEGEAFMPSEEEWGLIVGLARKLCVEQVNG